MFKKGGVVAVTRHFSLFNLNRHGKMQYNNVQEMKDVLKTRIFAIQNNRSVVFDDDTLAILNGDLRMVIRRENIIWENVNTNSTYSILQYGSNFIFRDFQNEICADENEFLIAIELSENQTIVITFTSVADKTRRIKLLSD